MKKIRVAANTRRTDRAYSCVPTSFCIVSAMLDRKSSRLVRTSKRIMNIDNFIYPNHQSLHSVFFARLTTADSLEVPYPANFSTAMVFVLTIRLTPSCLLFPHWFHCALEDSSPRGRRSASNSRSIAWLCFVSSLFNCRRRRRYYSSGTYFLSAQS